MKKTALLFSLILLGFAGKLTAQCPVYAATPTASSACGNQIYNFKIANTSCPSNIFFTVSGSSGSQGAQISWIVVNPGTGDTVAKGSGYGNNNAINVSVGPLNRASGTSFMLYIYDSVGNGFTGSGSLQVLDYAGNVIVPPFNSTNFTGAQTNQGFSAPINVPPVEATITTSSGTTIDTFKSCSDVSKNYTFSNSNYCTSRTETITWSVKCLSGNTILSSGSVNVTVYPRVPTAYTDFVDITWRTDSCKWSVVPKNDCVAASFGSVFTISPNPDTMSYTHDVTGTQNFSITYNGIPAGPNCCSTGGSSSQATFTQTATKSNATPKNSPFGGTNNSAYVTIGPAGVGGAATTGSFQVSISGYSYPQRPFGGLFCTQVAADFWVTIYVDGVAVFDSMFAATAAPTINVTLALIASKGVNFTSNSIIEVYVYPNAFNGYPTNACSGSPTTNTTYVPGTPGGRGQWTLGAINISNTNFVFTNVVFTPAICTFPTTKSYCCVSAIAGPDQSISCVNNPTGVSIGSSSFPGFTYTWSPATGLTPLNSSNPTANPVATTTYVLTVDGGNGCVSNDTVLITVDRTQPVSDAGRDTSITCLQNPSHIVTLGTSNTSGYIYTWSPTTGLTPTNTSNPFAAPAITTTYSVTTTNPTNGCTSSDAVVITVDTIKPNVYAGQDKVILCGTTSVTLDGASTTPNVSFAWSNGLGTNPVATATAANTYTLVVTGNSNGCSASDQVDVSLDANAPVSIAGQDASITCLLNTSGTVQIGTASTSGYSYTWSPSTGLSQSNISDPTASPQSTTIYTVTTTNISNGCASQASVTITVDRATPNLSIQTPIDLDCAHPVVTLSASSTTSGVSFNWSAGATTSTQDVTLAGPYSLTITDNNNGCTAEQTVNVSAQQSTVYSIATIPATCGNSNGTATINIASGSGPYSYNWNTGDATISISNISGGQYIATVTDVNGCKDVSTATVSQTPQATKPDIGEDKAICEGEVVVLNAGNGYATYRWQDGTTDNTYNATNAGLYTVIITDNNGCKASDTMELKIRDDCSFEIAVPTAFSPNGDGKNDLFKAVYTGTPTSFELRVFNRWGEKVFETKDVNTGWDGKYKGADAPMETYSWTTTYTYGTGTKKSLIGNMSLLR